MLAVGRRLILTREQRRNRRLAVVFDEPQVLGMLIGIKSLPVLKSVCLPRGFLKGSQTACDLVSGVEPTHAGRHDERFFVRGLKEVA